MNNSKFSNSDAPPRHAVVSPAAAGGRLDKWLSEQAGITSREMARRLILQGAAQVNGKEARPATRLAPGDLVAFRVPPPVPAETPAELGHLDVVYEDDWVLVINKPPGLTMHPSPGHRSGTLVNLLLGHCGDLSGIGGVLRPGIVHRLDKDTSGLVVVAKNDQAHGHLALQFKNHTVEREYAGLVVGQPGGVTGTITLPLGRHPTHRLKQRVAQNGRPAVTHWVVTWRRPPFARLKLRLETGRTHQIRVHMAYQGWPVLADPLYGAGRHKGLLLPPELQQLLGEFGRQALHAGVLGFDHPRDGNRLRFEADLPPDMAILEQAIAHHCPLLERVPAKKRGLS